MLARELKHNLIKSGVEIGLSLGKALDQAGGYPYDLLNMKVIDFLIEVAPNNIRFVHEKKDEN